jgi:hypothetical protein
MMLDQDIVAVSPSSVYRVLKKAGLIGNREIKASKKGTGFIQPLAAHQHWHIDVSVLLASSVKDEGRPFGIGLQEQIPNHHKRLELRVLVVSVMEKVLISIRCEPES